MNIKELKNKVICGDCLQIMKDIPDKSIDLCLTDPPYGINIGKMGFTTSGNIQVGKAKRNDYRGLCDWDKFTPTKKHFNEIIRISKNQIIFGGNYFTDKLPVSGCWIVWDKKVEEKYSNDFADCEMAWTSFSKPSRIIRFLWSGMLQGNMKDKEIRFHPTQKPQEVIKRILSIYSNENDLILDPFLGSGTTTAACQELNRNFIGIEISEKYCEIARNRLKQKPLKLKFNND